MTIAKAYNSVAVQLTSGGINWGTDTIKCALTNNSYVPDQDNHDFFNDITNEFTTGGGYTAGGVTLTGKNTVYTAANNTIDLTCANPSWTGLTLTNIRYAIFYKSTGVASTSPLIAYMDFEGNTSPSGQNVVITIPASGVLRLTVA